ncbi:glycosyltransferase family 4 protein [Glycomyces buryatensis]|uniref:Glycosyltransferase family 4 protein n=1 Tax=Glycomyces buryatensis TaxID=2570927 RepID=A0A4S8QPQ9_9ACTN|nr:glycosyltransferase family 4 protein [Glycomyces buryatensis]THV43399.1 glycosyltransferase family 4 protein [Glycomyces buryatensis]
MINVLFISAKTRPVSVLAGSVRKLVAEGARVSYGGSVPESWMAKKLTGIDFVETHPLRRSNLRRAVDLPFGERVWLRIHSDSWLRARAREAHVLVALDDGAVYTVWQLAQRNRTAKAVNGFAPALDAVRELAREGEAAALRAFRPPVSLVVREFARRVRGLPGSLERTVTARPIMRSSIGARLWRVPLRAPAVPDKLRIAMGRRVAEAMNWAGKYGGGSYALALTASKISDPAIKAELYDKAVSQEIDRGTGPKHLDQAIQSLLAHADDLQAAGEYKDAVKNLSRALALGFHRGVHIDQLASPLAADPEAFVGRFHRSRAMQTVMTPRGRVRPAAPPPTGRPLRLLVTTNANDNFLHHILDRYRNRHDVEVRYLDMATRPSLKRLTWADRKVMAERMGGDDEHAALVEDLMRPYLDWADTVFLDWCLGHAAMLTTIDPGDTRIIVRLHSYEAFTRWPHLVDFSRVDDLIFVGSHLLDLTTTLVPQLRGPQAPRTHVLHNAVELSAFTREKTSDARFNLGLVGVGQVVKDPLWAVEVLRLLREEDERYRLVMVGADMDPKFSRATKKYRKKMEAKLAPLVEAGAVLRLGPTKDVAGKLTDIGFILSSSVRESAHLGLMEGAASGAVPVVRDWPFFAGKTHSARTVYPNGWVVDTPAAAAQRILEVNATEENWLESAELASKHALSTWDWAFVRADFDQMFLGERR